MNNIIEKNETDNFVKPLIDKDYKWLKISRCSNYENCKKINNIRNMCEREENFIKARNPMGINIGAITRVNWCDLANAGIISANVKLYELFDNYDKNSTKLNNLMLEYTKKLHNLTWLLIGLAILTAILTCVSIITTYFK